jgi:hypothetical protein
MQHCDYTRGGLAQFKDGDRLRGVENIDVSSTRVNIGIRWYPGKQRSALTCAALVERTVQ